MDGLREYVLHITATALLCAVILQLVRGSGTIKLMIKLLCGIILSYSLIQPVKQLKFGELGQITSRFQQDAAQAVAWGENVSLEAWNESISQWTESYILEKAKAMDLDLTVEVKLSDDEIPVPDSVSLVGNIAPYRKSVLSDTISQDLNIPKEKQIWISQ